jgi:hypothetical protein
MNLVFATTTGARRTVKAQRATRSFIVAEV